MDKDVFHEKMHSDYTRAFEVVDIASLTAEQSNTLCNRLLMDVASIDSQRATRKARGLADSAWLTKSAMAKHYRMNLVRMIREHHTAVDIQSGFADKRCRALYHSADALVAILQRMEESGVALTEDEKKDLNQAAALLDSIEDAVDLASHRAGELNAEYKAEEAHILGDEVAEEHAAN